MDEQEEVKGFEGKSEGKVEKAVKIENSKPTMKQIFFGSKVEILKMVHLSADEQQADLNQSTTSLSIDSPLVPKEDKLSTRIEKLGPIYLDIKPG